ncbi:protein-L-isoaspartate O-methyltransferase [Selaginella moellendorffii]|nr:protein-L-isoaspartate O-methyltransferase [Selaginella moellendorffii]|eukprot:XP_002969866.2 protein-L-isoaspartate O-methyltransferase [Selaginella moellendorffii]
MCAAIAGGALRGASAFGAGSIACHTRNRAAPRVYFFHGMEVFWTPRAKDNKSLVKLLREEGAVKSDRVASVMGKLDRALFIAEGERNLAYMDCPMQIGFNATISAPHMHGSCLELLNKHLQPGMHALDVGSGTGYLTAAFALLVGDQGRAAGVEHIPELVEQSIKNVRRSPAASLLEPGVLSLHVGDGRLGWPEHAPYNAIHVGAAAPQVPQPLIDQLKPGGRMVIPVGEGAQELVVIDKGPDGSLKQWTASSVRYVPLTSKDEQLRGGV